MVFGIDLVTSCTPEGSGSACVQQGPCRWSCGAEIEDVATITCKELFALSCRIMEPWKLGFIYFPALQNAHFKKASIIEVLYEFAILVDGKNHTSSL